MSRTLKSGVMGGLVGISSRAPCPTLVKDTHQLTIVFQTCEVEDSSG